MKFKGNAKILSEEPLVLLWSNHTAATASRSLRNPGNQAPEPLQKRLTSLFLTSPEVAPAFTLLRSLGPVPELMSAENTPDSVPSALLAFGIATQIENYAIGKRTSFIIALAAGEGGDILRIIQVRKQQLGWKGEHRAVEVESLGLNEGEETRWTGEDGPILQICSGGMDGKPGQYIAVRRSESTTIFQPLRSRIRVQSSISLESASGEIPPTITT